MADSVDKFLSDIDPGLFLNFPSQTPESKSKLKPDLANYNSNAGNSHQSHHQPKRLKFDEASDSITTVSKALKDVDHNYIPKSDGFLWDELERLRDEKDTPTIQNVMLSHKQDKLKEQQRGPGEELPPLSIPGNPPTTVRLVIWEASPARTAV
ncbi:hypothetical protein KP79_PYT05031 [Mizuhopecten yessoensis]|uniref:Uncharacterized protein n=1 Tax=Mizuhopecten yessoensis TaxID=6573 RepID=A0A210QJ70_MIZYE|nr:hypothetical protein KP79_PYT05031 [Mizuhopecten yessoensis]